MSDYTYEEALKLVKINTLPEDFNQWDLYNKTGWTIAHSFVKHKLLPDNFDYWYMCDVEGWTVAHEALVHNTLPRDFRLWGLKNQNGVSVAQVAIDLGVVNGYKYLPDYLHTHYSGNK